MGGYPGGAEKFLNDARIAELWLRIKQELAAKQDKADRDAATDAEVAEMLDEVLGIPGGTGASGGDSAATEDEVEEMLNEVFGTSGIN